jgi:hypothetical protein
MAGLHSSQHLESETGPRREPPVRRFSLKRSCSNVVHSDSSKPPASGKHASLHTSWKKGTRAPLTHQQLRLHLQRGYSGRDSRTARRHRHHSPKVTPRTRPALASWLGGSRRWRETARNAAPPHRRTELSLSRKGAVPIIGLGRRFPGQGLEAPSQHFGAGAACCVGG